MTVFTGRTVAEAIEVGLETLNVSRDDVDIEILEEGRGGVFGLGHKPAAVRISPRGQEIPPAEENAVPADEGIVEPLSTEIVEETRAPVEQAEVIMTEEEPQAQVEEVEITPVEEEPQAPGEGPEIVAVEEESPDVETLEPKAVEDLAVPDQEADQVIALCQDFLQNVLDLMGLKTEVEATVVPPDSSGREPTYLLNIEGADLGILIGRRGETLEAIQYLVRLTVNRHTHSWPRIEVDVEHYKERRESSLQRLAEAMADRAVRDGRTITLEAMPARERRLIHLALKDRNDVYTESVGEGDNRKVTIVPVETA